MLIGKTAIVTGGASGIGLGIVKKLSEQGAKIFINGIQPQIQIKNKFQELKTQYSYLQANIGIKEQAKSLVNKCQKQFGKVDILINSAGIQHISSVLDFSQQMWQKIIQINLTSCFYMVKYVLPFMYQNNWGRIINIASVHGLVASPNKSAYVAAKHGLVGFTKATALQYAKKGITSNAICPGWVMTQLIQKQIQIKAQQLGINIEEAKQKMLDQKQPSGKPADIQDVSSLAIFLCSQKSKQINGSIYTIDGGWTSQ